MTSTNPFANDPDRSAIWTMLVERDIAAFVAADWSMVDGDFIKEGFLATSPSRTRSSTARSGSATAARTC
jgi:hypothetical protein